MSELEGFRDNGREFKIPALITNQLRYQLLPYSRLRHLDQDFYRDERYILCIDPNQHLCLALPCLLVICQGAFANSSVHLAVEFPPATVAQPQFLVERKLRSVIPPLPSWLLYPQCVLRDLLNLLQSRATQSELRNGEFSSLKVKRSPKRPDPGSLCITVKCCLWTCIFRGPR